MDHFAGLDVSVKDTSVCIVDDTGRIGASNREPCVPLTEMQWRRTQVRDHPLASTAVVDEHPSGARPLRHVAKTREAPS